MGFFKKNIMETIENLKSYLSNKYTNTMEELSFIASKFFPMYFLNLKDFPWVRQEDKDGLATISATQNFAKAQDKMLSKAYHWKKMSVAQREIFGDEITSTILSLYGIGAIRQMYEDESKDSVAWIRESIVGASRKTLLKNKSPFPLISSLVHEIDHRYQFLVNYLAKKDDFMSGTNPKYFSNAYQAYRHNVDEENRLKLYRASAMEQNSNLASYYYLLDLKDLLHSRLPSKEKKNLLNQLETELEDVSKTLTNHIEVKIELETATGQMQTLNDNMLVKYIEFSNCLNSLSNDSFHSFYKKYGKVTLREYLHYASFKVDQEVHTKLLKTLIKQNCLEAIDMVNTLGYAHSFDELSAVADIINNQTSETMFLPTLYRYLSHIPPEEITKVASQYMSDHDINLVENCMQQVFEDKLKDKGITMFNDEVCLDPANKRQYSLLIHSLYPGRFDQFASTFGKEYISRIVDSSPQAKYNTNKTVEDRVKKMFYKSEVEDMLKITLLDKKDTYFTVLKEPINEMEME